MTTSLTMLLFLSARKVRVSSRALSSTIRITLFSMLRLLKACEAEVNGRSLVHRALSPDAAAMPVDDALHGRKADACALELARAVEALKRAEQLIGISHVEARAIVADEIDRLPGALFMPESDLCPDALRRKLPSVAQQVHEHDARPSVRVRTVVTACRVLPNRLKPRRAKKTAP